MGISRRKDVHVVRDIDIGGTPPELPRIGREHEDVEPRLPRSVQQRQRHFVVVAHI